MARYGKSSNYKSKDEAGYTRRNQKFMEKRQRTTAATETAGPGQDKVITQNKSAEGTYKT